MRERLGSALGDRYRIEREVGRGGMAVVYLATDQKHGRPVAIKVLREGLAAAMGAERFLREIEIAARLNHPHILGLHDSGDADGLLYFVMPFVEGDSLRDRLDREGPLSLEDASRVVREVGSALAYAHERGLVHRDIKPENILFQAGQALVCDLGIAKAASEAKGRLTQTGFSVGTFSYMSPEQTTDEGVIDGRTDIYALGCIFYEMLTGEAPFSASSAQAVLAKKLMGKIPAMSSIRPDIPRTVEGVIAKALATSPDDRYSTAEQLVEALEYATTELAVDRDVRRRRRGRAVRAGAMLAGIGVLGASGWWLTSIVGAPTIDFVAVLPKPGPQDDPTQDPLVQGVYQDLALELSRAGVRVKGTSSVGRYANSDTPIPEIAAALGVDGIIQVSPTFLGDSVGVEVVLIDGETEELLWVESFSEHERNIPSLYREMTRAIAAEMQVALSAEAETRLAAAPEVDPAVYEALSRAKFHWQKLTEEGFETALEYYELALETDSTSAEAWTGVASIWGMRSQQGLVSAEDAHRMAEPALARALELDPTLSQLQAELALRKTWIEWQWDEGEAAFVSALEQNPIDHVTRIYYSQFLLYLGRDREAEEQASRAAEGDPIDPLVQGLYGQFLNMRGRHDAAEEVLRSALNRGTDAYLLATLRTTYHLLRREEDALDMWRASFTAEGSYDTQGDPEALAALESGLAVGGYQGALRAVAELSVERSKTEHVTPWRIATLYTRAGMKEEALDYLERAYTAKDPNCLSISVEPTFDFLRDEPRFQALIDGMGLPR